MIREIIRNNLRIHSVLRRVKKTLLFPFNFFPLQEIAIFESNPDFNDEGFWFCNKFMEEHIDSRIHICWLIKERDAETPLGWNIERVYLIPKSPKEWFRKQYILHCAKYIFDSCLYIPKLRKGQFRLFLFHAMPLKRVDQVPKEMGEFDFFSAGSNFFKNYYEKIGIESHKLICFGLSRNDRLCLPSGKLHELLKIPKEKKVILWMPTYRQHKVSRTPCEIPIDNGNMTGMPVLRSHEDYTALNASLQEFNMVLVIKPHQSQDMSVVDESESDCIKWLSTDVLLKESIQLYDILADTDALITDYSSIYVDYLLLEKPIALTVDDLEEYEHKVGFVFDNYKKNVKGYYIKSRKDFENFIRYLSQDHEYLMSLIRGSKEIFHDITDYSSADRLFEFVLGHSDLGLIIKKEKKMHV